MSGAEISDGQYVFAAAVGVKSGKTFFTKAEKSQEILHQVGKILNSTRQVGNFMFSLALGLRKSLLFGKGNVVSKNIYKGRKELISVAWSLALLPKIVWDGL